MFGGADRAFVGEQGAGRAGEGVAWCFGEQVQPVRVSRGWEDRGSPRCFGGTGTGYEGEQGAESKEVSLVLWGSMYSL